MIINRENLFRAALAKAVPNWDNSKAQLIRRDNKLYAGFNLVLYSGGKILVVQIQNTTECIDAYQQRLINYFNSGHFDSNFYCTFDNYTKQYMNGKIFKFRSRNQAYMYSSELTRSLGAYYSIEEVIPTSNCDDSQYNLVYQESNTHDV